MMNLCKAWNLSSRSISLVELINEERKKNYHTVADKRKIKREEGTWRKFFTTGCDKRGVLRGEGIRVVIQRINWGFSRHPSHSSWHVRIQQEDSRPFMNHEVGSDPHQTPNLQVSWTWTFQLPEPLKINFCFFKKSFSILYFVVAAWTKATRVKKQ